jgi:hypothetical protein
VWPMASSVVVRSASSAVTLVLLAGVPACSAQPPEARPQFSVDRRILFAELSASDVGELADALQAAGIEPGDVAIAREDLDDDGVAEVILIGNSSMWCGSGGCAAWVFRRRDDAWQQIFGHYVFEGLAITREKVGAYRALAVVDDDGRIVSGERPGTPMYGRPLVYPIQP